MKVLVVDDTKMNRELARAVIEEMGHEVLTAENGQIGVDLYLSERPDLVLMDVIMPVLDGYEATRKIREKSGDVDWIPIIFLSSMVNDQDVAKGIAAGGDDYLAKPISPVVLGAKISAMQRITGMRQRLVDLSKELASFNQMLQELSDKDGLTGIANRRSFDEILHKEWRRGTRAAKPLALIMLDVDCFKRFNDTYGHQAGDDTLISVARALEEAAQRDSDTAARYGGEEFAVILPATPLEGALQIAEDARARVEALGIPHEQSTVCDHVTVSLGISIAVPDKHAEPTQLVHAADQALYKSKQEGRNQVNFLAVE